MPAKMLYAALVTLTAMAPAALAGEGRARDNSYVIALGKIDAANPQDVGRVMKAINNAGREACLVTGSRIASSTCVEAFVREAIGAVKDRDLQTALLGGDAGGGMPRAATAPKSE